MSLVAFRKQPVFTSGFDDFDRLFDNMFKNALINLSAPAASVGNMAVRLNVSETDKAYLVEAELPGIDEKDIEVTVKDGVMTISGETQSGKESEGKTFHRVERSYGRFQRSLQLPADADEDGIEAHMKNGILALTIGKVKEAQKEPRRINIKK